MYELMKWNQMQTKVFSSTLFAKTATPHVMHQQCKCRSSQPNMEPALKIMVIATLIIIIWVVFIQRHCLQCLCFHHYFLELSSCWDGVNWLACGVVLCFICLLLSDYPLIYLNSQSDEAISRAPKVIVMRRCSVCGRRENVSK